MDQARPFIDSALALLARTAGAVLGALAVVEA